MSRYAHVHADLRAAIDTARDAVRLTRGQALYHRADLHLVHDLQDTLDRACDLARDLRPAEVDADDIVRR